ncbi:hypothetical protein SEA_SCHIMMELS22_54 [Microbacterium phage Schimmels22]|nr:hypothetical protein SEA_SCHIMMELS22_54 [Microbacterium phage Schimmels22]
MVMNSLGKAVERLQKAATSWKGFRHAAVRQSDVQLVLDELERVRVLSLRCVLEDHEGLKDELARIHTRHVAPATPEAESRRGCNAVNPRTGWECSLVVSPHEIIHGRVQHVTLIEGERYDWFVNE